MRIRLTVNDADHELDVAPATPLLDVLREQLALTGAKRGCGHGQCGACTVLVGERRVLSCLQLAATVSEPVRTVEGLADGDTLHPLQQAFLEEDAFQCGYCTPGQLMSAVAVLASGQTDSDEAVRAAMAGNLCRCAAYPQIVRAIRRVAEAP
jgi:xanthine dehydrogenase YagT iron-sulfur-binding subunit